MKKFFFWLAWLSTQSNLRCLKILSILFLLLQRYNKTLQRGVFFKGLNKAKTFYFAFVKLNVFVKYCNSRTLKIAYLKNSIYTIKYVYEIKKFKKFWGLMARPIEELQIIDLFNIFDTVNNIKFDWIHQNWKLDSNTNLG